MAKKIALILAAGIFLVGCSRMPIDTFVDTEPRLVLEEYFVGDITAYGIFENRSGDVTRQFKVDITGTYEDGVLVLNEDFLYQNGETDNRIWTIKSLGDGKYEGFADGVIGVAKGEVSGNAFNWKYVFDLPVGDTSYKIKFDDWMFLQDDGVLINRAKLSKWGFEVGSVTISFKKTAAVLN
jgi:hypothetical protein